MRGGSAASPERGSATVLAVGVLTGLITVLLSGLVLVAVLVAGQQARTAADLAALAGMGRVVEGAGIDQACAMARAVAADNGAEVTACGPGGDPANPWPEVLVTVARDVSGTPWSASASAVAGSVAGTLP